MPSLYNLIKFTLKSFLFGSLIAGCALYGVIASIILRLIGKPQYAQYSVARLFYFMVSSLMGIKINVINGHFLKESMPAIYISNHQSVLDILVLGKIFQPGFTVTGKKSLKYVPFLGWFMLLSGTFFLDRSKGEKARRVLESALALLKKNKRALFIFPEGTRAATQKLELLPFKKGAFHLAKQASIPVVPIVVSNTSTIFNSATKTFNRGEITIEVLPPVKTTDLKNNDDVTSCVVDVQQEMLAVYQKLGYAKAHGTPTPIRAKIAKTPTKKAGKQSQGLNKATKSPAVATTQETAPLLQLT